MTTTAKNARSGNPAKKAAAKKATAKKTAAKKAEAPTQVTSVSEFKKRSRGELLALPSGAVVRAKKVSIRDFIVQGNVPNPLMEIVSEALNKAQTVKVDEIVGDEGEVDVKQIQEMFEMVKAVVMAAVVEPKVHPEPESEAERDDDVVYIDEVDAEDMMFIFQWVSGGTSDLERFREEARADMASLAEGKVAGATTK